MYETAKASPSAGLFLAWLAGVSINEWAAFAGLLYTLMLICQKCWEWRAKWLAKRNAL